MSGAIEAIDADRAALLDISRGLTDELWQAPSGCAGWRVQDLVAHLANLFWLVVDPTVLPDTAGLPTETAQELAVQARRDWSAADVLADYEAVSKTGLDRLAGLAGLDGELSFGDLGTYQLAVLPSAYSFDHYTHIRADLFAPRGPLTGEPPPSDELRLGSALDWVEAALPQQNAAAADACTLEIHVTGTVSGGTVSGGTVSGGTGSASPGARLIRFGHGQATATISSDGPALVRWITQRGSWAELDVEAAGDAAALAAARTLKVF
jgi:uncharacterized protein (TIGR03083 family)